MRVYHTMSRLVAICLLVSGAFAGGAQTALKQRAPYRLQVNDTVKIMYRYTPQFDETVKVHPDGSVSLAFAGTVQLEGHTLDEAKELILKGIGAQLVNPLVNLELVGFEKPYFVVAGQVMTPGRYDMASANPSVIEAIAQAGGFKSSATNTRVIVYHKSDEGLMLGYVVDCKKAMQHPTPEVAFMVVHPGDVIIVPQNKFSSAERLLKLLNLGVYYPLPQ